MRPNKSIRVSWNDSLLYVSTYSFFMMGVTPSTHANLNPPSLILR
jgi:hypothetical protein